MAAGRTNYRKKVRIFPGVSLNKNGPFKVSSWTLGKPGFVSMTLGQGKKRLNVDLPGGYSYRKELGKSKADEKARAKSDQEKLDGKTARSPSASAQARDNLQPEAMKMLHFFTTLAMGIGLGSWFF